MNNKGEIFCPFCGSIQEAGQNYCYNCGASLEETNTTSDSTVSSVRILNESTYSSFGSTPSTQSNQNYSYGSSSTQGTYRTHYQPTTTFYPKKENANIALILAIVGFFMGCFILPIIGFVFLNKAKQYNEDPKTIRIAQILLWIQLIFWILGIGFYIFFNFLPFLYF